MTPPAWEGREIPLGSETLTVIESNAEALVLEAVWPTRTSSPPPHLHPRQQERFDVLEGALEVEIDGTRSTVAAGEAFTVPPGSAHRMRNPGPGPARARWTVSPALRTEALFRELAAVGGAKASPLVATQVLLRYRDEFRLALPSPLEPVAVRALATVGRVLRLPH